MAHWRRHLLAPLAAAVVISTSAPPLQAEVVVEPVTKRSFPTTQRFEQREYQLIGVGSRRALGFITIFGAGLYLESNQAREVWQTYRRGRFAPFIKTDGLDITKLRQARALRHFMVYGNFPKALVLEFVKNTTAGQCDREYREGFGRYLEDLEAPRDSAAIERFLADVSRPMSVGDKTVFRTTGHRLFVTSPEGKTRRLESRRLVHAFWSMYFGREPMQVSLRQSLLARIELLDRPEKTNAPSQRE